MNRPTRSKLVIRFSSYRDIVLDSDKVLALLELIRGAERYESKYHSKTDEKDAHTTTHVYPYDEDEQLVDIKHLTDSQYALAKIAGKPVKD